MSGSVAENEIARVRSIAGLGAADHVLYDEEGWDSRVYVVNRGAIVFKFPRTPAARAAYADEVAIMQVLDGGDGRVVVPTVEWIGPDSSYLGYRGIVGRQLGRAGNALSADERKRVGHDLGRFLATLHGVELGGLRRVTVVDELDQFTAKFRASQDAIADEFSRAERRALDEFFSTRLPQTMQALGIDPATVHGDLGAYNLILGDDGRIGVIDFGDVAVVDRAKDFMGFDAEMGDAAISAYGEREHLREKVEIRRLALPVLDLPFYLGKGDARGVAECVNRLRGSLL